MYFIAHVVAAHCYLRAELYRLFSCTDNTIHAALPADLSGVLQAG